MKYKVLRTDTADAGIRKVILFVEKNFGTDAAFDALEQLEHDIMLLADNPYIGTAPKYPILKKMGYHVLILEKDLVFYKVNDAVREVTVYAVVDQREDYLDIIKGL